MPRKTVEERFWEKVQKTDGCWLWTGAGSKSELGYGLFYFNGRYMGAHRASWIMRHGEIPDDLFVCHHCDNPTCIRPAHLFLGTQKENLADRESKGRTLKGKDHWAHQKPERLARGSFHGNTRLTESVVREMRQKYADKKASQNELSREYGLSQASVNSILMGKTWAHAGGPITKRGRTKLDPDKVRTIRQMLASGLSQSEVARRMGVGNSTIQTIDAGLSWTHVK